MNTPLYALIKETPDGLTQLVGLTDEKYLNTLSIVGLDFTQLDNPLFEKALKMFETQNKLTIRIPKVGAVELTEGPMKKGGTNERPTTPPPSPPIGQGGSRTHKI